MIDPDSGSGTDYTTLYTWESNEQRNLVSSHEVEIAKCRSTLGSADAGPGGSLQINGWTTGSENYIQIWTDPEDSYRHEGVWDNSKYRFTRSEINGYSINIIENHVRIIGLQITGGTSVINCQAGGSGGDVEIYLEKNIFNCSSGYSSNYASYVGIVITIGSSGYTSRWYFSNNLIYGLNNTNSTGYARGFYLANTGTEEDWKTLIYNNTIVDVQAQTPANGFGITANSHTHVVAKNNIVQNTSGVNYSGSFDGDSDYNLGDDATAPGTTTYDNKTVGFVDIGNEDYRLAYTDSEAKENAYNLSSDEYYEISDDIAETSRPVDSNWDLGCFETTSGITSTSTTSTSTTSTSTSSSTSTSTSSSTSTTSTTTTI